MNDDRILLSETIERIGDAVNDIRTTVDMQSTGTIEDVADAVEALASNEYNAYKVDTVLDMGRINPSKLNDGDMCTVMDNNHSYLPYRANALTRALIFPKSFTTTTYEEFSDVNFGVVNEGNLVTAGGTVSLTKGGGSSGSDSGSSGSGGSSGPTLIFDLRFISSTTPAPCHNFICRVVYSYDEDTNIWTRTSMYRQSMNIVGNIAIFPLECGFNKTGGGDLPNIIFDCLKLPNYVADPVGEGLIATGSTTIAKSHVYDGFYLPYEVIYSEQSYSDTRLNSINPTDGIQIDFLKMITTATGAISYKARLEANLGVDIWYTQDVQNPTHYYLNKVLITDKVTNENIYNYEDYNLTYPNYDFYVYFPSEYYANTEIGFIGRFFNQITVEKPRMYRYNASEGLWMAQL